MGAGSGAGILARTALLAGVIVAAAGSVATARPDRAHTVVQKAEAVDSHFVDVIGMLGQKRILSSFSASSHPLQSMLAVRRVAEG